MPLDAFVLALGSAFLHALWNLILGRERDPEAATAIALVTSVVLFAPLAIWRFDADAEVWPYIAVTSMLQLTYFAALATAYRHADVSVVYPIARGLAPVLVLLVGVTALGTGASAGQAAGVCLVGVGVMLVRGIGSGHADGRGVGAAFGVAVASCIAAYTLVDKHGIEHASPVVYLELGMIPATIGYVGFLLLTEHGTTRVRSAARPLPALAGILSFVAYALVLAALVRASAAAVASVRETSVLIAAFLAAPLAGERVGPGRLSGAALVVAGVALIAAG
jgi:drug/metabolite transporter (DMT)-like permease